MTGCRWCNHTGQPLPVCPGCTGRGAPVCHPPCSGGSMRRSSLTMLGERVKRVNGYALRPYKLGNIRGGSAHPSVPKRLFMPPFAYGVLSCRAALGTLTRSRVWRLSTDAKQFHPAPKTSHDSYMIDSRALQALNRTICVPQLWTCACRSRPGSPMIEILCSTISYTVIRASKAHREPIRAYAAMSPESMERNGHHETYHEPARQAPRTHLSSIIICWNNSSAGTRGSGGLTGQFVGVARQLPPRPILVLPHSVECYPL